MILIISLTVLVIIIAVFKFNKKFYKKKEIPQITVIKTHPSRPRNVMNLNDLLYNQISNQLPSNLTSLEIDAVKKWILNWLKQEVHTEQGSSINVPVERIISELNLKKN